MNHEDTVLILSDLIVSATKQNERREGIEKLIEHYEKRIAELKKLQQHNCCCGPEFV